MLFVVWVVACLPFVCVMAVGVGVCGFWWCCFQWCVAVVWASSCVPGVVVGFGVWVVCSGVVWLVSGVGGLVCVVWFRMLTCLASFFLLVLSFVLSCCLVNNGLPGCVGAGGCLLVGCLGWCGCVLWAGESVFVCLLWVIGLLLLVCWPRVVCVWGYWLLFCL